MARTVFSLSPWERVGVRACGAVFSLSLWERVG
jgi:hypothetical protein